MLGFVQFTIWHTDFQLVNKSICAMCMCFIFYNIMLVLIIIMSDCYGKEL